MPPRTGQQRPRRRARTATWEGIHRWWLIALGALGLAVLLPRLGTAQGLRSRQLAVTLQVEAPPHLRASADRRAIAQWRGASVADARVPLSGLAEGGALRDARLERAGAMRGAVYLRGADGALTPVGTTWASAAGSAGGGEVLFRIAAPGGEALEAGTWRVRLRLAPADGERAPVEHSVDLVVPDWR
ncbi:MAG TPA: hypothetical protein VFV33_06710 [Gemmatimonadaceae bacterium]|nr:hypothetical protein [Gemmatimonadaceae bacterium]